MSVNPILNKNIFITLDAAASSGTWGFSAGVSLDVKGSQTTSNSQDTKSLTSNLNANNITIKTDKDLDTNVTVSGSNIIAQDEINIETKDLMVKASSDTTISTSDTKDLSGSVSMTMYGAASGPSVSLGYAEQHSDADSVAYNNSQLQANTINITTSNDANFEGANVNAKDTLNLSVGNNLNIESKRNASSSNSNGFNISAGISTGGGSVTSANASVGANTGRTKVKQTVLSSVTGDKVNVTTGNNTNLKGALLAAGQYDENGNFIDNNNLNLNTKTLTFSNSTDSTYTSGNSFSLGTNIGFSKDVKDPQPKDDSTTKINSTNLAFSNSMGYQRNKTLATLGQGNVTITDTQNSDDTTSLNRDTQNISKTMINTSYGVDVDATLDHRLLTEDGREEIKQEYKDMGKNMAIIGKTLPKAESDNPIESTIGTIWDWMAHGTLDILPSNKNNGGVLGEIPILSGNKDSVHLKLQLASENAPLYLTNPDDFIHIEQSDAYKQMSQERQSQVQGLYISKEPVTITKENATYQNGGNGILNSKGQAIYTVMEQTGMLGQYQADKTIPVEATVFYNPSRGILADLFESAVDTLGGTTGIAKQYGEFNVDVTTARRTAGANITNHSQANILLKSGVSYINNNDYTGAKFMPQEYFYTGKVNERGEKEYNLPTYVSFGSPVSGKELGDLISNKETGLGYTYKGAFTKPDDFVGEGLGRNSGVNGEASIVDRLNILNVLRLFYNSPHSSYNPYDYKELKDVVGYKK